MPKYSIDEHMVNIKALVAAVITQAEMDLHGKDMLNKESALAWFKTKYNEPSPGIFTFQGACQLLKIDYKLALEEILSNIEKPRLKKNRYTLSKRRSSARADGRRYYTARARKPYVCEYCLDEIVPGEKCFRRKSSEYLMAHSQCVEEDEVNHIVVYHRSKGINTLVMERNR